MHLAFERRSMFGDFLILDNAGSPATQVARLPLGYTGGRMKSGCEADYSSTHRCCRSTLWMQHMAHFCRYVAS